MSDLKGWLDAFNSAGSWFLLAVAVLGAVVAWAEKRMDARKKKRQRDADVDPEQDAQHQADHDAGKL